MGDFEVGKIHPTAIISNNAEIGSDVTIGPFTIIYDGVKIGDNTVIGAHCILGEPVASFYRDRSYVNEELIIGKNSVIRSGSIIYTGSKIGDNFESGHRVTIREAVFIGNNVRVGTLCDIQDHSQVGCYSRLHSNVFIGQKTQIGNYVWIFPHSVVTNDRHPPSNALSGVIIEDFAVIAAMVLILPGLKIGRDSLIGAHSLVRTDIPEESVAVGNPAKVIGSIYDIKDGNGNPAYPWRYRFDRGMPWEGLGYENWLINQGKTSVNGQKR